MTGQIRKPWSDGIGLAGLWPVRGRRNEELWQRLVNARKELIAKVIVWRDSALKDGWTINPTYSNESVGTAFSMRREGFYVLGLARPATDEILGTGEIHCWGSDGLAIPVDETYDWEAIKAGIRICPVCGKTDVTTVRYSFAGRCCEECLPEMRRIHEKPGWCD